MKKHSASFVEPFVTKDGALSYRIDLKKAHGFVGVKS
jgi:hypothetical protein